MCRWMSWLRSWPAGCATFGFCMGRMIESFLSRIGVCACVRVCVCACLSVGQFVCLSVCLFVCLSPCLSVLDPSYRIVVCCSVALKRRLDEARDVFARASAASSGNTSNSSNSSSYGNSNSGSQNDSLAGVCQREVNQGWARGRLNLVSLAGYGHLPHEENPARFAAFLRSLLPLSDSPLPAPLPQP